MNRIAYITLTLTTLLTIASFSGQALAQKPIEPSTPAPGQIVQVQSPPSAQPSASPTTQAPQTSPAQHAPAQRQYQPVQQTQPAAQPTSQQPAPPAANPNRYAQTPEFVETPPEEPVEIEEGLASRYVDQYIVAPQNTFGIGVPLTTVIIPEANPAVGFGGQISISRSFSDYFQLRLDWSRFRFAPDAAIDETYMVVRGDIRIGDRDFELNITPYVGIVDLVLLGGAELHMRWRNDNVLLDVTPYLQIQHGLLQDVAQVGSGVRLTSAVQLAEAVAFEMSIGFNTADLDFENTIVTFNAGFPIRARSERVEFSVRPNLGLPHMLSPRSETPFDVVTIGVDLQLRFLPSAG